MRVGWPKVRLAEVIRQRKEFITIDDFATYQRARVQLHGKGILLRDEVPGSEIKTKRQQVCRSGEFLVAEIDAKVGGFGMVPRDLEGAIVSSHYFLFGVDESKLNRHFLDWFIRTRDFRGQVEAQGSTNYAAIRSADVLGYEVSLPPLAEQQRIVDRIEALAAEIREAQRLRQESAEALEHLVASTHFSLSGARKRKLGDVLRLDEDSVRVVLDVEYPQVGVRSFGVGLFAKSAVAGTDTAYKAFNRLYPGAVLLSQVKGWEGAVAVCPPNLAGWFVSPEYRTFRCIEGEASPGYFTELVRTEWFWSQLAPVTRGVGARRERTRPEQFLSLEMPMPTYEQQLQAEKCFSELNSLRRLSAETVSELDALLPAILDRAFKGELHQGAEAC